MDQTNYAQSGETVGLTRSAFNEYTGLITNSFSNFKIKTWKISIHVLDYI
jgi:ACT domain-containing protein